MNPNQTRVHVFLSAMTPSTQIIGSELLIWSGMLIPLKISGSTVYVKSRVPTMLNLSECNRIVLTSDAEWDPSNISLQDWSNEEVDHQRLISSVRRGMVDVEAFPEEPQVCMSHSFAGSDALLASVSSALTDETMYPCLVAAVRVHNADCTEPCQIGSATVSDRRLSVVSAEGLEKKWRIGINTAKLTLKATTQHGLCHALHPIHCCYRTNHMSLRYNRLNTTLNNRCAQLFCSEGYTRVYPLAWKLEAGVALQEFIEDVGIPSEMGCDGAGNEQVGPKSDSVKTCSRVHGKMRRTEPHSPGQKQAGMIGETKKRWTTKMSANVPGRVWDYGLVHESMIMSHISREPDGCTGYERMTDNTPDISEMLDFDIWDLVWYHQPGTDTSEPVRRLERWLGVAHRIESNMCYWVGPVSGVVLACTTVQHVTPLELQVPELQEQVKEYNVY